jgi:hypothetical protein
MTSVSGSVLGLGSPGGFTNLITIVITASCVVIVFPE